MPNLNLVRQLGTCLFMCETQSEIQSINRLIDDVTLDKQKTVKELDGDEFRKHVMCLALLVTEKVTKSSITNEPLQAPYGTPYFVTNKIKLIKMIRDIKNWGLKETKEYVETLPLRFF